MDVISLAMRAYSGIEKKIGSGALDANDYEEYFELLSDDAILKHNVPTGTPIKQEVSGKESIKEFFSSTTPELFGNLRIEDPLEFLHTGRRVVVLGRESYIIKKTETAVSRKAFAVVLDFRDGLIVQDHRIKEMTEFVDSCRHNSAVISSL